METVKLFFKEAWVLISSISWRDFIDIALVTIILFYAFRFIRDRRAGKLIVGVVLLVAVQVLSEICGLGTINFLLGNFFEVGVLAIIILFQPELRSALEKVGSEPLRSLKMIGEKNSAQKRNQLVDSVCEACCQMAKEKTGALIVFERKTKLGEHINSGTVINADPSAPMIENVFFKNSPLHDGALVIRNDRLYAAGCFLPLSSNDDFRELGTRPCSGRRQRGQRCRGHCGFGANRNHFSGLGGKIAQESGLCFFKTLAGRTPHRQRRK